MRYHIDTIPVWDAYKRDSECPLCDLRALAEQSYLESFLGASVMEPGVRIEVNAKGFCARHFDKMLGMQNRLGLALMTHTHLKETMAALPDPAQHKNDKKRSLFLRKEAKAHTSETCILCDRLEMTMGRYLRTVVHLWNTDKEFNKAFAASKGVCLPHARALAEIGPEEFVRTLDTLQRENLARIEKELEWFTLKFDYRNADKPWGSAKDAPERAILKLRGKA